MRMATNRHFTRSMIPANCPSGHCVRRMASGYGYRFSYQDRKSGFAAGRPRVGRSKLYLLDANDFANSAAHRGITSELYGGDAEMRLKQEIVLGIGGWRLLRALGLRTRGMPS